MHGSAGDAGARRETDFSAGEGVVDPEDGLLGFAGRNGPSGLVYCHDSGAEGEGAVARG